jgi:hypothetical protein
MGLTRSRFGLRPPQLKFASLPDLLSCGGALGGCSAPTTRGTDSGFGGAQLRLQLACLSSRVQGFGIRAAELQRCKERVHLVGVAAFWVGKGAKRHRVQTLLALEIKQKHLRQICSASIGISFRLGCTQIRRGLQELCVCKSRGRKAARARVSA